jgi:Predicted membrane protein (DUF2207) C-terminal domain
VGLGGFSGVGFSGVSVTVSCSIARFALAAMAAIWSATLGFRRLGVVDAGPATSNLRDEPPAVVNLLVHTRGVNRGAFLATLLELAARDVTEVFELEPGRYALRLSRDGSPLPTAIERMAVATLRSRRILRSGISPRRAFPWYRFGPFVRAVVNNAVDRGLLVEQRFLFADWASVLALVLVVAALLLAGSGPGTAIAAGLGLSLFVQAPGLWASRRRHGILTATGTEAAVHWKGVGDYLRADREFTNAPPTSVAIWGPYLAYAVALDTTEFDLAIAPSIARRPVD